MQSLMLVNFKRKKYKDQFQLIHKVTPYKVLQHIAYSLPATANYANAKKP